MNPEEIVAAWLEMPRITDGMTELQDLIEAIRDYGATCAAEMRETCARTADKRALYWRDARDSAQAYRCVEAADIADLIRALPTTPSPPERPAR